MSCITGGGGIDDAPDDGAYYVRRNSEWESLTDVPVELTWDGDTEGKTRIDVSSIFVNNTAIYKISDDVTEFNGGPLEITFQTLNNEEGIRTEIISPIDLGVPGVFAYRVPNEPLLPVCIVTNDVAVGPFEIPHGVYFENQEEYV